MLLEVCEDFRWSSDENLPIWTVKVSFLASAQSLCLLTCEKRRDPENFESMHQTPDGQVAARIAEFYGLALHSGEDAIRAYVRDVKRMRATSNFGVGCCLAVPLAALAWLLQWLF